MMSAVIVATNVIVAGLLTANDDSPVAQIPDGVLAASFPFVVSPALPAGNRAGLDRPALRKAHGLRRGKVQPLMVAITEAAIVLTPDTSTTAAADPGDTSSCGICWPHAPT